MCSPAKKTAVIRFLMEQWKSGRAHDREKLTENILYVGYTTQSLFRQTLFRQSMHSLDVGWLTAVTIGLRAVPIGKTPNQIPKIRGSTIVLKVHVRCNFSRGWGTPDPLGYPPQALLPSVTSVPRSMPCFRCIERLDPFQFLPNFYYFYTYAKRALGYL